MSRKLFLLAVLFILVPALIFAQNGKLRGLVTDQETEEPLIGANVQIEGTTLGASTDMKGEYVVLAIPSGVYSIRVTYIGFQTEVIQNIRINSAQTTTLDFLMGTEAIRGQEVVIVAERPLIQRNTTNTVRMTTEEDIQSLPIRGLDNIVALNAGVVKQDGELHIRGGRQNEVAFYIDGATATSPFENEEAISVIQEAISEVQVQSGGFTAEQGGSNSGVVATTIRSGGAKFTGSLDYRTDDFAGPGEEFLGTTSQGFHNLVATFGGPIGSKFRYFSAIQYNYQKNRDNVFIEPINFDAATNAPWLVEDGLEGRVAFQDQPLPNEFGEAVPFEFKRNWLPNNWKRDISINSTLVYNMSSSLRFRLSGSYASQKYRNDFSDIYSAVNNYYSNQMDYTTYKNGVFSLRATHILNPTTFYEVQVQYGMNKTKNFDPRFGDDWQNYGDKRAWGSAGLDTSTWENIFEGPLNYSSILNFNFESPNSPKNNYSKRDETNMAVSMNLTSQITKNIELLAGGKFEQWNVSRYQVNTISGYLQYRYGLNAETWDSSLPENGGVAFADDYIKRIQLTKQGQINHYGYNWDGTQTISDGPYGPRKPYFASAYMQTKWEYRDLILNLGLRWERIHYNEYRPASVEDPDRDINNLWLDIETMTKTEPYDYLMPRINFAFPVTDNTVFYAQYGQYVQSGNLSSIYRSVRQQSGGILPEVRSVYGSTVRFLQKPERTNQYELGIRQTLSENFAFTLTTFYRDLIDLRRYARIYSDGALSEEPNGLEAGTRFLGGLANQDVATIKGLEMTMELRRTQRLAARVNYTLSDARGTGSTYTSASVVQSDATIARFPMLIYPLDHNHAHSGSIMLDYRFVKGDGGKILEGVGLNLLMTFQSGHNYTQVQEPANLGQVNPWNVGTRMTYDERGRFPTEPLNSSVTPWNFNIDMSLEKMLYFGGVNVKLYTTVLNLLNTRNIINVYQTTGTDDDDGWLKSPLASQYRQIDGYEAFYRAINQNNGWGWAYAAPFMGTAGRQSLWGAPRQIRFGVTFEIK